MFRRAGRATAPCMCDLGGHSECAPLRESMPALFRTCGQFVCVCVCVNVAKALSAMMKAILQLQQQTRDMARALHEAILIHIDWGLVQAMRGQTLRRGSEHRRTIGPPRV